MLYVTGPNNFAWALDAKTGKSFWRYRRTLPADLRVCCGPVNRGFAMLGNRLFMTTLDAHLIALDARTGEVVWDIALEDYKKGYASTIAPLVVKNKVIVGVAGGEYGAPGFIAAYDVETGKRVWKFNTVPPQRRVRQRHVVRRFGGARRRRRLGDRQLRSGVEPCSSTAPATRHPTFMGPTGWATTCSPTRWWRSTPTPASGAGTTSSRRTTRTTGTRPTCRFSATLTIGGRARQVVMVANRNGFFYTIDRTNGQLLVAKPYVYTTWAKEVGARWPAGAAAREHAGRKGLDDLSRPVGRDQFLCAVVRSEAARCSS